MEKVPGIFKRSRNRIKGVDERPSTEKNVTYARNLFPGSRRFPPAPAFRSGGRGHRCRSAEITSCPSRQEANAKLFERTVCEKSGKYSSMLLGQVLKQSRQRWPEKIALLFAGR